MDHWIKNIELIKNSPSPIEVAISIVFKSIGRENWLSEPLFQTIFNSPEFDSSNVYQNQYRTAEIIYSCFTLLKNEILKGFEQHLIILIFAALFHNFKHSGRVNKYPFENEKYAIEMMYDFAQKNNIMKLWGKQSWMNLKNMPSWVNSTDAIEEIIFCADFSDIKNIEKNYLSNPEDLWRSDLPIHINKLKQIFLEAMLMPNVLYPYYIEENKKMMSENGITGESLFIKRQIKHFLQNFAIHIFISHTSKKLKFTSLIQENIHKL